MRNPELEAAIIENYKNLNAWAVYGDWLQTQGDPRGELIALELARQTSPNDALLDKEKEKRINELYQENAKEWFGADPELKESLLNEEQYIINNIDFREMIPSYHRAGFVSQLNASPENRAKGQFLKRLQKILPLPSLIFLEKIIMFELTWKTIQGLSAASLPALKSLKIRSIKYIPNPPEDVSPWEILQTNNMPKLEHLHIEFSSLMFQFPQVFADSPLRPQLKELELKYNREEQGAVEQIPAYAELFQNLNRLEIITPGISIRTHNQIEKIPGAKVTLVDE